MADQTQTPEFKRWFGNSKVVDAQGRPLVVYHGTRNGGFTQFDLSKIDPHHHGFFFTDSPVMASSYSGDDSDVFEPRSYTPPFNTKSELDAWLLEQEDTQFLPGGNILSRFLYARTLDPRLPKELVDEVFAGIFKRKLKGTHAELLKKATSNVVGILALGTNDSAFNFLQDLWSRRLLRAADKLKIRKSKELRQALDTPVLETGTIYRFEADFGDSTIDVVFEEDPKLLQKVKTWLHKVHTHVSGLYSVYLSLQNPFEVDAGGTDWSQIPRDVVRGALTQSQLAEAHAKGVRWAAPKAQRSYLHSTLNTDAVCQVAKLLGYDGVIIRNCKDYGGWSPVDDDEDESRLPPEVPADIFVAFTPTQIKSANHNRGTFDPHDADIRNPALTVASLFAGGGGWEVGAVEAGLRPVWASELQADIAAAHDAALPGAHVYVGDVTKLSPSQVAPVDILCVSPPCQGYSWARVSKKNLGEREDLLVGLEAIKFIQALKPKAVLMENVTGYEDSDTFWQLVKALRDEGYNVDWGTVSCQFYNVPSTRRRLVIRATLKPLPQWPQKRATVPSWDDALSDLIAALPAAKPLAAWQQKSIDLCPPPAGVDLLISGGGGSFCVPVGGVATGKLSDMVKKVWQAPGKPGPTMVASAKSMTGYRILQADGTVRRFTPRCAARLQSFPDWYKLPEDAELAFKIVGNAVPPQVAKIFIESVLPAC